MNEGDKVQLKRGPAAGWFDRQKVQSPRSHRGEVTMPTGAIGVVTSAFIVAPGEPEPNQWQVVQFNRVSPAEPYGVDVFVPVLASHVEQVVS